MDQNGAEERQLSQLKEKEFTTLLPVMALISCANSRATELHSGFGWRDEGWLLHWPDEVVRRMGLQPSKAHPIDGELDRFRVFFEPVEGCEASYWYALFGSNAPALIISYEASQDEPPFICHRGDDWLQWTWHVHEDERLAQLDRAIAAAKDVAAAVDWVELAKRSATDGPRSILYTGVTAYLARRDS